MAIGNRRARIYVRDKFAGILSETDEGYRFIYDGEYLSDPDSPAVSLTLPKRRDAYASRTLFAFFDGLIPEGWLLEVVVRSWKVDAKDRFGLLLAACSDCIGAVSVKEVDE